MTPNLPDVSLYCLSVRMVAHVRNTTTIMSEGNNLAPHSIEINTMLHLAPVALLHSLCSLHHVPESDAVSSEDYTVHHNVSLVVGHAQAERGAWGLCSVVLHCIRVLTKLVRDIESGSKPRL